MNMSSNKITKTLYIDNMTCINCENIIEQELSKTIGVESITASYSKGTATVTYDTSVISLERIEEILKKEDYHVKKVDTKESENSSELRQANNQTVNPVKNQSSIPTINQSMNKNGNQSSVGGFDLTNLLGIGVILFALYMVANHLGLLNIFNSFPIAKEGMGYGMLFMIGLLTSVHCVAMCGGICLSQCVPKNTGTETVISKFAAMRPSLLYNLGRVISYTIIGGIVGAIGSVVSFSGPMKGFVQILAGVFMVIMGLNMLNISPWLRKFNPRMPKIFAKKIYAQRSSNSPLYIGILNGLMPCGPLQAMQLYALSTGSPLKGALAMFLFSVGTFPLMFIFGALSSYINKKFTGKMMTASAVLVVVLGVFMFNNGIGLSGIQYPAAPITSSQAGAINVAVIEDGVQVVTTNLSSGRYEPITVQKDIPVKWIIQAKDGDINGCNNSIVVPKYNLTKDLEVGDNVIEFTPTQSETVPFSCWMGMIRSKITVVDDLNNIGGSSDNSGSTNNSNSTDNENSEASGLESFDNLLDIQIPTDEIGIAEVVADKQTVSITLDQNGFTPAVIVVQSGLETVWTINGSNLDTNNGSVLFPYYYAQLTVKEGENPIDFYPDQDFDFFTVDGTSYGYVKVVDDINNLDLEAIKKEVSEYRPTDPNVAGQGSGAGLPSCH
jgi:sulfite exporter TauE/SafE/copper chaperone CopZ/plastocyanin domain-containing protein